MATQREIILSLKTAFDGTGLEAEVAATTTELADTRAEVRSLQDPAGVLLPDAPGSTTSYEQ